MAVVIEKICSCQKAYARSINKISFVYSYEDGELKVGWRGFTWGANRSYLTFTKPSLPAGSIIDRIELKIHLKGGSKSTSHVTKICKLNYHSSNNAKDYYDEMDNSTQYASGSWLGIPTSNPETIDLISAAVTDYLHSIQNFYIGIKEDGDNDSWGSFYGINEGNFYYPSLIIYYIVPYVNVDKTSLTLSQSINSANSLQITSNTSWNASVNVPWISINPLSGSNDKMIEIKATSENQTSTPRNATLTITGINAAPKTVKITQEGITLQCSPLTLELESFEGSSKSVNVTSNYAWEASSNEMWLYPDPSISSGNGTITVNAALANPSIVPRTGLITVKSGELTKTITVTQKGSAPILTVTPPSIEIESTSGPTGNFTVISNTSWTVADDASWLTLSSASGLGNGKLTVTASSANTSNDARIANITFSASGVTPVVVTVTQAGTPCTLNVTPSNRPVAYTAGNTSFNVTSTCSWTATSNQNWCTVTPSGNGNGTITANYTVNPGTAARDANITVTVSGVAPYVVTVTQDPAPPQCTLTVTPPNRPVTFNAGNTSFTVASTCSWTATSNQNWCTVTPSGNGNGTITANYTANPGTTARVASITGAVTGVTPVVVTVTQDPPTPCTLTVSPAIRPVAYTAGNTSFNVTTTCSWTATSNQTWCTVTPSGTGNETITATYIANPNTTERVANITVTVSGVTPVVVTVTQAPAPCTLTVTPANRPVAYAAGNTNFSVTSNCNWTAASNQTWCTVTPSGSGNGTLTATFTANPNTTERVANITVTVSGVTPVVVTVTQAPAPCTLTVTPSNRPVAYTAGNTTFAVTSNCGLVVTSNQPWCTVTPSGTGNGTITATYTANPNTTQRDANITVTVSGVTPVVVTVTQEKTSIAAKNLLFLKSGIPEDWTVKEAIGSQFKEISEWEKSGFSVTKLNLTTTAINSSILNNYDYVRFVGNDPSRIITTEEGTFLYNWVNNGGKLLADVAFTNTVNAVTSFGVQNIEGENGGSSGLNWSFSGAPLNIEPVSGPYDTVNTLAAQVMDMPVLKSDHKLIVDAAVDDYPAVVHNIFGSGKAIIIFADGWSHDKTHPGNAYRSDIYTGNNLEFLNNCIKYFLGFTVGFDKKDTKMESTLLIFPNPISLNTKIIFELTDGSPVFINLLDVNGKIIKSISSNQYFPIGKHQLVLQEDNLPAGVYLLEFKTKDSRIVKKIIKAQAVGW